MRRQHPATGKSPRLSYLELLAAPFWVYSVTLIQDYIPLKWVVAAALSFVGWLFVRKR